MKAKISRKTMVGIITIGMSCFFLIFVVNASFNIHSFNASSKLFKQTNDGGFITGQNFEDDFSMMRFDHNGDALWHKLYGGDYQEDIAAISITSDGGHILMGSTQSFADFEHSEHSAWVIKLNSDGSIQWQYEFAGTLFDSGLHPEGTIQETPDGGFIGGGRLWGTTEENNRNHIWIFKLNSQGELLWQRAYAHMDASSEVAMIHNADNNGFWIVGHTIDANSLYTDLWVLRLSSEGSLIWQKDYRDPNNSFSAHSSVVTSDGGLIVAHNSITSLVAVIRLDSNGTVIWRRDYRSIRTTLQRPFILESDDGNFILAATATKELPNGTTTLPYLAELSPDGSIIWQKTYDFFGYDGAIRVGGLHETNNGDIVLNILKAEAAIIYLDDTGEVPNCPVSDHSDIVPFDVTVNTIITDVISPTISVFPMMTSISPENAPIYDIEPYRCPVITYDQSIFLPLVMKDP